MEKIIRIVLLIVWIPLIAINVLAGNYVAVLSNLILVSALVVMNKYPTLGSVLSSVGLIILGVSAYASGIFMFIFPIIIGTVFLIMTVIKYVKSK